MGNPKSQDWVRLEVLILRRACTILRKLFRRRWKISQNSDWMDSPESGKKFISDLGAQVYQSCGRLHKMTLEEGDVNNWDFTILTRILQQVDFKADEPLKQEYENENQRLEQLISYSKKAIEYPEVKTMGDEEFSKLWDQIEKILVSFGESEKELEELKRTESISEDDLLSLSGDESHPIDQLSISEARRLKDEAKSIINSGGNVENALNCLTSAIGLHNLSDMELGALYASRSEGYLRKAGLMPISDERKKIGYLALKDAKHALSIRPAWGLAYYRVGMAYVELNKLKKASKYLDQALDLEPNTEEIKVANNSCKVKMVEIQEDFAPHLKIFQKKVRPLPLTRLSPAVMDKIDIIFFNNDDGNNDNILKNIYQAQKLVSKQNYKDAAALYRKASKCGNAEGMYNFALLQLEGKGVKQNVKAGIELLKKSAKQPHKLCQGNGYNFVSNVGVVESEFVLGLLAHSGISFPPQRDFFSASVWYHQASENGHGGASHNLGILFSKGQGVVKDEKRALQLWKLGASRKVPESMHAMAISEAKEWDSSEARRWLELAINEYSNNYFDDEGEENDNSIWTPTEIQKFKNVLDTIDHLRKKYGQVKEISRWESFSGLSPGKVMNQNLNMKHRIVRMLHGLEMEKDKITEIEEYFKQLEPKPVIINFPNAKAYINSVKKEIMDHGVNGIVVNRPESSASAISTDTDFSTSTDNSNNVAISLEIGT